MTKNMKRLMFFLFFIILFSVSALAHPPDMVVPFTTSALQYFNMNDYVSMSGRYMEISIPSSGLTCSGDCSTHLPGYFTFNNKNGAQQATFSRSGEQLFTICAGCVGSWVDITYHGYGSNIYSHLSRIYNVEYRIYFGEWNYVTGFNDAFVGYFRHPDFGSGFDTATVDVGRTWADIVVSITRHWFNSWTDNRDHDVKWDVFPQIVRYREVGTTTWNTINMPTPINSNVREEYFGYINGLSPLTQYEWHPYYRYRWLPRWPEYIMNGHSMGMTRTFTTTANAPTVTSNIPSNVGYTSATMNGGYSFNDWNRIQTRFRVERWTGSSWVFHIETSWATRTSGSSLSQSISGLQEGTQYRYRVEGRYDSGSLSGTSYDTTITSPYRTFTTDQLVPPTAVTDGADPDYNSAQLWARVFWNDWNNARLEFRYRRTGTSTWLYNIEGEISVSSSGGQYFSGNTAYLEEDTQYQFQVGISYPSTPSGSTGWSLWSWSPSETFTTLARVEPTVTSISGSATSPTTASFTGSINLGDWSLSNVRYQYRWRIGTGSWTYHTGSSSTWAVLSNTNPSFSASGLNANTNYQVELRISYPNSHTASWSNQNTHSQSDTFSTPDFVHPSITSINSDADYYDATLFGVVDKGDWNAVHFQFRYKRSVDSTWIYHTGSSASWEILTQTSFNKFIDGLVDNTLYDYQLRVAYADTPSDSWNTNNIITESSTFTTDDASPMVYNDGASDVTHNSARLVGTLDIGGQTEVQVYFKYEEIGSGNVITVPQPKIGRMTSGEFSTVISGLESSTGYSYTVLVDWNGDTYESNPQTFVTLADEPFSVGVFPDRVMQFNDVLQMNINDYFGNYDYIRVRLFNPDINNYEELRTDIGGQLFNSYFDANLDTNGILTINSHEFVYDELFDVVAVKDTELTRTARLEIQEPPVEADFYGVDDYQVELPEFAGLQNNYNFSAFLNTNYFDRINNFACSVRYSGESVDSFENTMDGWSDEHPETQDAVFDDSWSSDGDYSLLLEHRVKIRKNYTIEDNSMLYFDLRTIDDGGEDGQIQVCIGDIISLSDTFRCNGDLIYSRAIIKGTGDQVFLDEEIDLSSYSGQTIEIKILTRYALGIGGGFRTAFNIDNIRFVGGVEREPLSACDYAIVGGFREYKCPFAFYHEDDASLDWSYGCEVDIDGEVFDFEEMLSIYNFGTIPTPPPASGGGGGGSSPTTIIREDISFDVDEFFINPSIHEIFMSRGEKRLVEFRITNTYVTALNFTLNIIQDSIPSRWMSFHETQIMPTTNFEIRKLGGITEDSRFVRYYITVPDDIEDGRYEGIIQVSANNKVEEYIVFISVGQNPIREWLSRNLFVTENFRMSNGLFTVLVLIILGISLMSYSAIRNNKK